MERVVWCLVLLVLAADSLGAPGKRVRRGYGSGYGDSSSGYGRGSDERDASVSEENNGCNTSGYGRGYGGNRERAYSRDGWPSDTRGGRSFTRSAASAIASASAYTMNRKANNL